MTDTSKKPRTWTIVKDRHQIGDSNNYEVTQVAQGEWIANNEKVKVIEYGAYQSLLEQCEKLEKALEFYSNPDNWQYESRINTNGIVVNSVMKANDGYEFKDENYCCGKKAKQALQEYRKFKGEL